MHRSFTVWPFVVLLGVTLLGSGCRSQHPDGHVQITPSPPAASQVEPPASRLGGPTTDDPHGGAPLLSDATALSGNEQAALMEAFNNASPEVRAMAAQRLAALKAQSGSQTAPPVTAEKPAADSNALSAAAASEDVAATETAELPKLDQSTGQAAAAGTVAQTASTDVSGGEGDGVDVRQAVGEMSAKAKEATSETADASTSPTETQVAEADAAASDDAKADPAKSTEAAGAATEVTVAAESTDSDPLAAASDEQLFEALIARYQKRVTPTEEATEVATEDLITLRTLTTLAGNPDAAVTPIDGWNASEQEFLNFQMLALWQLIDPGAHPVRGRRWAMALPELRQATSHLAASTGNLDVRGLAFCTSVESYGRIKPFPADQFTPGQQVILYSELENFVAERLSDGYETHLRGTYEIFDANGRRVADQVLPEDRQTCNNYRRDYFIAYQLYLPSRLAPGTYRLELTMEDLKGKKYGQASIPLEIVAK